jgi:hypothetical protein
MQKKDSSALKSGGGVPDERKNGHQSTAIRGEEEAHIHSSGTSTCIADERKGLAGIIQSADEVFMMAREHFGLNEKGGAA